MLQQSQSTTGQEESALRIFPPNTSLEMEVNSAIIRFFRGILINVSSNTSLLQIFDNCIIVLFPGAFIVLDILLERMRHEHVVDVFATVQHLRGQRNFIVQTEDQYAFIYEALVEAAASGNTEVPARHLAEHWTRLTAPLPPGIANARGTSLEVDCPVPLTGLELEFNQLAATSAPPSTPGRQTRPVIRRMASNHERSSGRGSSGDRPSGQSPEARKSSGSGSGSETLGKQTPAAMLPVSTSTLSAVQPLPQLLVAEYPNEIVSQGLIRKLSALT
ncbi:unnamed protein product, partial [Protopolystoma xenopodis]